MKKICRVWYWFSMFCLAFWWHQPFKNILKVMWVMCRMERCSAAVWCVTHSCQQFPNVYVHKFMGKVPQLYIDVYQHPTKISNLAVSTVSILSIDFHGTGNYKMDQHGTDTTQHATASAAPSKKLPYWSSWQSARFSDGCYAKWKNQIMYVECLSNLQVFPMLFLAIMTKTSDASGEEPPHP